MADNYLERRMEDYRAGRIASSISPSKQRVSKRGTIILLASPSEITHRFTAALSRDFLVILCGDASSKYRLMAQKSGARLYPFDKDAFSRALQDYPSPDLIISIDSTLPDKIPHTIKKISFTEYDGVAWRDNEAARTHLITLQNIESAIKLIKGEI